MITRINIVLAVLLGAQLALLGVRAVMPGNADEAGSHTLLLPGIDTDTLVKLHIETADDSVNVERDGPRGEWRVTDLDGYDADTTKVSDTLRQLAALKIADVVSTSGEHYASLKVSDKTFDRRLTLEGGGKSISLLFGSSGRANSTHVRKADDPTVYAVRDFSTWKLSAQADSWIDRTYFAANRQKVQSLTLKNSHGLLRVERDGKKDWQLVDADGRRVPADASAVDELLGKATHVTLMEVAGKVADHPLGESVIDITLAINDTDANADAASPDGAMTVERVLHVAKKPGKEERYLLHTDDSEFVAEASKWAIQPLADAEAKKLQAKEPSGDAPAGGAANEDAPDAGAAGGDATQ